MKKQRNTAHILQLLYMLACKAAQKNFSFASWTMKNIGAGGRILFLFCTFIFIFRIGEFWKYETKPGYDKRILATLCLNSDPKNPHIDCNYAYCLKILIIYGTSLWKILNVLDSILKMMAPKTYLRVNDFQSLISPGATQ